MSSIILIRHAQSEHQVENRVGGWADFPLTGLGRRQAHCLASRLRAELGNVPCRIYCSDLKRAVQSAEIVGRALDSAPNPVAALRDICSGIVTGMPEQEARRAAEQHGAPLCLRAGGRHAVARLSKGENRNA